MTSHKVRLAACVAVCVAVGWSSGCASVGAPGSGGASSYFGRQDERRLIGSYADVRSIGVSRRYAYAATPSGITVYDRLFNTWLPPLSRDLGLTDAQITFMAGDPVEDAVWIGVPGALIAYRPQSEQLQRTMLTGIPEYIAFDRATTGDVYVRAGGQWTRVSRVGMATPMAGPPAAASVIMPGTLNDVYNRYPGLRSSAPLLYRNQQSDRPLRSFPIISGSLSPDMPSEVWLGTSGDGMYKVDGVTMQSLPLRFGLLDRGVGAVALAADGVWAAGLGQSQLRGGLTFATNDMQRWRWIDGTISVPMMGMRASSISIRGSTAWVGTDRGVVRVRLDGSDQLALWTALDGLPDDRVLSVAARADGAWIGTMRGLVFIADSADSKNLRARGVGQHTLNGTPIYALQSVRDTLWIGTVAGLVARTPGGALLRPLGGDPALRSPVTALAWSDSVLLAATENGVLQVALNGGANPSRVNELNVGLVGQVTRLAMDDRTIVMAGTDGVVVLQRHGGIRVLRAPNEVSGPALDVAMSREWIWIGTPAGLLRLRRASDGGLP